MGFAERPVRRKTSKPGPRPQIFQFGEKLTRRHVNASSLNGEEWGNRSIVFVGGLTDEHSFVNISAEIQGKAVD